MGFKNIERAPTYGDTGLASFTEPNLESGFIQTPSSHSNQSDQFGYTVADMNDFLANNGNDMNNNNSASPRFDLPTRQRTPGMYRSPQSGQNLDMGMSPDSNTNGSMSQPNGYSSHTSNTGYSPPNDGGSSGSNNNHATQPPSHNDAPKNHANPNGLTGAPALLSNMFDADFDMSAFVASPPSDGVENQQGFVLPQAWNSSTGLTPGPAATAPDPNDMMGMTDADWNQVLADSAYPTWDPSGAGTAVPMAAQQHLQDQNMHDGFGTGGLG